MSLVHKVNSTILLDKEKKWVRCIWLIKMIIWMQTSFCTSSSFRFFFSFEQILWEIWRVTFQAIPAWIPVLLLSCKRSKQKYVVLCSCHTLCDLSLFLTSFAVVYAKCRFCWSFQFLRRFLVSCHPVNALNLKQNLVRKLHQIKWYDCHLRRIEQRLGNRFNHLVSVGCLLFSEQYR